jgi:hypothetical protein
LETGFENSKKSRSPEEDLEVGCCWVGCLGAPEKSSKSGS